MFSVYTETRRVLSHMVLLWSSPLAVLRSVGYRKGYLNTHTSIHPYERHTSTQYKAFYCSMFNHVQPDGWIRRIIVIKRRDHFKCIYASAFISIYQTGTFERFRTRDTNTLHDMVAMASMPRHDGLEPMLVWTIEVWIVNCNESCNKKETSKSKQ